MIDRSRCLETLLIVAAVFFARSACADPSPVEISSARRAFESAVSLESAGQWAQAALELREALAVKDTPGLRFHLAHCEAQQGLLVEAALDYDRAGELIQKGAKAPDVQKRLLAASAALQQRIPRLTLALPSELLGPVASIDGKVVAPSELALGVPLDPGRHELRVSASGRRSFERSLSLKEAESLQIRAELPLAPAAAIAPLPASVKAPPLQGSSYAAPVAADSRRSSVKLYLVLGESALTIAGLTVGIAYKLAASSAKDRVATAQGRIDQASQGDVAACGEPENELAGACSELSRAIDDHDRAVALSTAGFVTAGVGVAALVTTLLAYPKQTAGSTELALQPLAGLGRIGVQGRF